MNSQHTLPAALEPRLRVPGHLRGPVAKGGCVNTGQCPDRSRARLSSTPPSAGQKLLISRNGPHPRKPPLSTVHRNGVSPAWFAIWVSLGSVFPVPVQALSPQDGVCDRTAEIRDAIVSAVTGVTDCAEITETQLGQITTLSLFAVSIPALAADDLVGLSGLVMLNLAYTGLTRLPATVFDDLTSLVAEREKLIISAQVSTGLIDDVRVAVIPARRHGAIVGGCAPAG